MGKLRKADEGVGAAKVCRSAPLESQRKQLLHTRVSAVLHTVLATELETAA